MNVYQKMAVVKQLVNAASFKKSGENKFANFKYYELRDFIPFITEACTNNGLLTMVNFTREMAILTIVNADNPEEQLTYTAPFIVPEVKGANATQNAGAAQTYSRRYLYLAAFDIVEQDVFDSTLGQTHQNNEQKRADEEAKKREAQAKADRKKAEQAVIIGQNEPDQIAYELLQSNWSRAGKQPDKLEWWIRTEAVNHGLKAVGADFLRQLDERIIAYLNKEAG